MAALAAILDESGSWISFRHNYRPNQVHCTWFRVYTFCHIWRSSNNKNFNMATMWSCWIHIFDLKVHDIYHYYLSNLIAWNKVTPIACYMNSRSGDHILYIRFQMPISKWPPWQPSWMSQGHEFHLDTTSGPTKYIALGFMSASRVGLLE